MVVILKNELTISVDVLVISVSNEEASNYRRTDKKKMSILLKKNKDNRWCLPNGVVKIDEDLDKAPIRILKEETNIADIYLEQLYTFGNVGRCPLPRVISSAYMALVDKSGIKTSLSNNVCWFDVSLLEDDGKVVDIVLDNGIDKVAMKIKKMLREKTTDRYEFKAIKNDLVYDNPEVILSGLERLKNKISYTDIVFNMMPEYFTLGELQQVYEVILGKKLLDPAFRRIIAHKVVKTQKMKTGGGHRPSAMFKYKGN